MKRVLLVDPGPADGDQQARFAAAGLACERVADAEAGWRAFTREPPAAVFTALATPRGGGAWLLRRMQEDYLGTLPPVYALVTEADLAAPLPVDFDAALLGPLAADAAIALARQTIGDEEPSATATRTTELFECSLLHGDLESAVRAFLDRGARAFRATDLALVRAGGEPRVWAHRGPGSAEAAAFLRRMVELAAAARTALVYADPSVGQRVPWTYLAAPLEVPGGGSAGTLCAIADGPRRFLAEERTALRALARRTGVELTWRSAHDRLTAEHDRLRQGAVLDPLLGVLTRSALEDALAAELSRAAAQGVPVTVAIFDVVQLRHVNETHGHLAGDAALAQLADAVRGALRPEDLVGRIGGDEIGVILPGLPPRDARPLLEKIIHRVGERPFRHLDTPIPLQVRAGAVAAAPGSAPADSVAHAVSAVHYAKRTGAPLHVAVPGESRPLVSITGGHEIVSPDSLDTGDALLAGSTLAGMYQVRHEISRGAMGVVYRAEDLGLRRPVAVKVLKPELARDVGLVTRFRNEAATLAAVRHEHLVQVYSFGSQGEDVFFVMELVEGESLAELLQRVDSAGEAVALDLIEEVVAQVGGALDALHRAGTVHRDVKPANILIDRGRDRAVLVDVGVAKREGTLDEAVGTPGFGAPESFMQGAEGPWTDVYGLAATAYMLLTHLAPFGGGDVNRVLRRQLGELPAPPSVVRPELSPKVDEVLLRALRAEPRERHGSALELAQALAAALNVSRTAARPPAAAAHATLLDLAKTADRDLSSDDVEISYDTGSTRGALFRVIYRILGNRLGSAWVQATGDATPALRKVLRPSVEPLAWIRTEHLVTLLAAVPPTVRDPHKVARELGRAAMTATFARFLGSDPAKLGPGPVLAQARRFWSRFHTWGSVSVELEPALAMVTIAGTPRQPLLCSLVEGSLERIAELAGGMGARASHPACERHGAAGCRFEISWVT